MLPVYLAVVDLIAGLYLVSWAYRREQRDKPGVLIVGSVLLVCALSLGVLGWPRSSPDAPTPPTPSVGVTEPGQLV